MNWETIDEWAGVIALGYVALMMLFAWLVYR
jgi:hypothetical protein